MSIATSEIRNLKSLLTKKGRKEQNRFIAEGVRLLEEALRHHVLPTKIYYTPHKASDRLVRLVENFAKSRVKVVPIAPEDLNRVSDTSEPQGILAVFDTPPHSETELWRLKSRRIIWCENIADPGNLGTLIRSALAFGFGGLLATGSTAEFYSPKVVRSSAGAVFGMKLMVAEPEAIEAFASKNSYAVVATDTDAEDLEKNLKKILKYDKLLVAVGAEGEGLTESVMRNATFRVRIRHSPKVESLNAAVAGSIIMSRIAGLETIE